MMSSGPEATFISQMKAWMPIFLLRRRPVDRTVSLLLPKESAFIVVSKNAVA